MDFLAIGDTAVDEFIRLKEARVNCDINNEDCTISMKWGDKVPYESSELVSAVGNAANAAVAAARLGLSSALLSNVGNDRFGEETLAVFKKEGVSTEYIKVNDGIPTNHHYVLWYESERTILIKHEVYPYALPEDLPAPRWLYLSSMGEESEVLHSALTEWLRAHPETKLAFQPGTFQIKMGREKLASVYERTELIACNREEAERILGVREPDIKKLLEMMRALGPKIVLITDGTQGAYCYDGAEMLKIPLYPDEKTPYERTGAGDATTSTIVAALALGIPLQEALLWGPINAMSVVQGVGAQKGLLTKDALRAYLAKAPAEYRVTPV